jgi:hypothetical protein
MVSFADRLASPTEYLRLEQQITLDSGDIVTAWVYVYNHSTKGLQQILSGDFCKNGLRCLKVFPVVSRRWVRVKNLAIKMLKQKWQKG